MEAAERVEPSPSISLPGKQEIKDKAVNLGRQSYYAIVSNVDKCVAVAENTASNYADSYLKPTDNGVDLHRNNVALEVVVKRINRNRERDGRMQSGRARYSSSEILNEEQVPRCVTLSFKEHQKIQFCFMSIN